MENNTCVFSTVIFPLKLEKRQECPRSPVLFNVDIEGIISQYNETKESN